MFSTFLEYSQISGVFHHSACSTRRTSRLYRGNVVKDNKTRFSMFYTLIKHEFLTNESARRVLSKFLYYKER